MMVKGLDRGIFIYHTLMTSPFDELCLHLQDCCGGCPYCVELCQRVVDEANEIAHKQWEKEYTKEMQHDAIVTIQNCATLPSMGESTNGTYVDISRGWLGDFIGWIRSNILCWDVSPWDSN